jgi:hypothetical protein
MPGFNGKGPTGAGPMTGGAGGLCNLQRRNSAGGAFGSPFRGGRGRGRGTRNTYGVSSRPRPGRVNLTGFRNDSFDQPYGRDQEMVLLKEQAAALRQELKAIDRRLEDFESGERNID